MITPTKRLPGGYALIRFEGRYDYVAKQAAIWGYGGVLEAPVGSIGRNDRFIVAERFSMNNVRGGWMIIDIQSGAIRGPLTAAEFADAQKGDASLRSIEPVHVDEAWKR